MDELKKIIREIAQENSLKCSENEINMCAYLAIAHAATHKEMLAVLKNNQIETDEVLEKEYILYLYAILKRYVAVTSDDMSILLLACIKAIFAEQTQNNSELQAYYLTKKAEMDEVEGEYGSGAAVAYTLINSNCKFFEEEIATEISKEQLISVRKNLLDTIDEYGVHNWIDVQSTAMRVSEKDEKAPKDKNLNKSIKRKRTPLEVFHDSTQLCVLRTQLLERIDDLNNRLNKHYDEHEEYARIYHCYHLPAGERAKPIIIAWFVSVILSEILSMSLLFLAATIIGIAVFVLLRKWDHKEADRRASQAAAGIRDGRLEQEKNRTKWEEERDEYTGMLERVTDMLNDLIPIGGIAQAYWNEAQKLWNYVELKAADSLKEAIVLYRDAENYEGMINILNDIQRENQKLHAQVRDLSNRQTEMAREMNRLEMNQQMLALNALYDWPPAEMIVLNMI